MLGDVDTLDVLIIGGGMAGVTALLSATEGGARALLLERSDALGGSTVMSSGLLAFAGTEEQAAAGVSDSEDLFRRDLLETGKRRNSEELVNAYAGAQLATYQWLVDHGVEFLGVHPGSGQSVARSHPVDTTAAIELLSRAARRAGAEIRFRVRAQRLLVEDDRVVGVRAEVDGDTVDFLAKVTILTSGGFSRNPELLTRFAPDMDHALRGGASGCMGDGLLMACKIGAALIDTPYIKGTFGIFPWPSPHESGTGILPIYKGGIAVNGYGHRFINESLPYKEIGDACLAQPESIAYQIFDTSVLEQAESTVGIYDFRPRVEGRQVQQSETIDDLAEKLGLPPEELAATVEEYNRRIDSGEPDEFGRTTLSGGVGTVRPLIVPPFYGYPSTTVVLATYCGIKVDEQARVIDVYGETIPGLYAAGELTGGFHGAGYVTGTSIGKAAVFGRVSGTNAAEESRQRKSVTSSSAKS
jgi:fumarate reductase flavoprotein subunit